MTDAEIIEWMQTHALRITENMDESFTLEWLDYSGFIRKTSADSLPSCVKNAQKGTYDMPTL